MLALELLHIASAEEEELRARFGEAYIEYKKRAPKLFPNVGLNELIYIYCLISDT